VTDVDAAFVRLTDDMFTTMYEALGIGLAAPQVGVQKRFFVYDHGDGAGVILNPRIMESDGEWAYEEGCLSVPGLFWEIVRPKRIHLVARIVQRGQRRYGHLGVPQVHQPPGMRRRRRDQGNRRPPSDGPPAGEVARRDMVISRRVRLASRRRSSSRWSMRRIPSRWSISC